ncbi:MAG TPA: hypothetical protein VJP84_17645 [Steroidobacteraceae bacterium]|jgi:hypothetical protein|nr:hypothetical protein [Steroidobacteraceae bacterium]
MDPQLHTAPGDLPVRDELMQLEPLFHRPELGSARSDFERMTAPEFWEVGASGRRYGREFVLDILMERVESSPDDPWEIEGFHCARIAVDHYLATYTLLQGARVTRRATIWRRSQAGWQAVYHQGTLVAET